MLGVMANGGVFASLFLWWNLRIGDAVTWPCKNARAATAAAKPLLELDSFILRYQRGKKGKRWLGMKETGPSRSKGETCACPYWQHALAMQEKGQPNEREKDKGNKEANVDNEPKKTT